MPSDSRLVYSTDGGRARPAPPPAKPPQRSNRLRPAQPVVPNDGVVRIQRDKRGRGGKTATVVTGLPGHDEALDALLKALKQHCGAGGTREGRTLILQGDQRDRLMQELARLGHSPKLAGG